MGKSKGKEPDPRHWTNSPMLRRMANGSGPNIIDIAGNAANLQKAMAKKDEAKMLKRFKRGQRRAS